MYHKYCQQLIMSNEYQNIEQDSTYVKLIDILQKSLPFETFLDVEELLHEEMLLKIELGFLHGYHCGLKNRAGE